MVNSVSLINLSGTDEVGFYTQHDFTLHVLWFQAKSPVLGIIMETRL